MIADLDPRLLRIGIEVAGVMQRYEGLAMVAAGCKYANAMQNECEIKITNLARATRDYIITQASPFNRTKIRKRVIVEAGRVSYGYSTVYEGDVQEVSASQPPDITLTIKAGTCAHQKGQMVSNSRPGKASMSSIAGGVAKDLGLSLRFEAQDKNIANYAYAGGALNQVNNIGDMGRLNCYVDDSTLIVKDYATPLKGLARVLNIDTGMIGIPEFTERGLKVRMLYDNQTKLGSGLQVTSQVNPAANGEYVVYKLGFELASRDTPFYLIAEAQRIGGGLLAKHKKAAKK